MGPVVLGIGLLINEDAYTEVIILCYWILSVAAIFGIEVINNLKWLKEVYDHKSIIEATLVSHLLSLVAMMIYVMT